MEVINMIKKEFNLKNFSVIPQFREIADKLKETIGDAYGLGC